jgi:signal transduction histidine kinase
MPGAGFGLFSIKERLEYMEGEFVLDSEKGRGTCVMLRVPIKQGRESGVQRREKP